MAQSKDHKTRENPTLVTVVFLGALVIIFMVVLGILPYRTQTSSATEGTDGSTPTLDANRQYGFGITDYMAGDYKAAIEDFTRAIDAHYTPLARARYERGMAYYSYSTASQD